MAIDHEKLADKVAGAMGGKGEPDGDEPTAKGKGEAGKVLEAAIKSGNHAAIEDAVREIVGCPGH